MGSVSFALVGLLVMGYVCGIAEFFGNPYCVYYILAGGDYVVMNIPVILVGVEYFMQMNYPCAPNGYVISVSDVFALKKLFSTSHGFIFLPHTTIVVNYNGVKEADFTELVRVSSSRAVKFVIVLENKTLMIAWDKLEPIKPSEEWKPSFTNETFKIGLFHFAPFVYMDSKQVFYKGIEKDILDQILFNWPIEYFLYGPFSWSYSLQELEKFKIDLALGAHWDIRVRTKNVDISFPYVQVCLKFLVPKPTITNKLGMIFKPFAWPVWVTLITTAIALSVFTYTIKTSFYGITGVNYFREYCDVIMVFFASPISYNPRKLALKITLIICSLTTILVTTSYSARLVTYLVAPSYTKPVNTMEDMLEAGIKWYLVPEERPNWDILDKTSDSRLTQLFNTTTPVKIPGMAVATNLIPNTYITDLSSIYDNKGGLWKVASECVGAYYMVFPMQKHSPYLKFFDRSIKRLVEHGHVEYWIFQAYNSFELQKLMQPFFDNFPEGNANGIYIILHDVLGVFIFWMCGLTLSTVVFCFEYYKVKFVIKCL